MKDKEELMNNSERKKKKLGRHNGRKNKKKCRSVVSLQT